MLVSEYRIGAARFFAADRGLDLPPGPALEKLNQCLHFAWISHWIYIYQPGHHAFPHPKDAACRFFPRRFHSCSCVPKAILPVSGRRTLSILSPLRRRKTNNFPPPRAILLMGWVVANAICYPGVRRKEVCRLTCGAGGVA